jgi:hypothetical protein
MQMSSQREKNATHGNKSQRLAKGASKAPRNAQPGRAGKNSVRKVRRRDSGRALADERELSPLGRLLGALSTEKIRFQVIGMSAANMQGVPGSTIDVDLWLDLPSRQYIKALNIAVREGAQIVRNTVVELADQTLVNFIYEVTGLPAFKRVIGKARKMKLQGLEVSVLPLELIRKSKEAIGRPKDLLHIELIKERLEVIRRSRR